MLSALRKEYSKGVLDEKKMPVVPMELFKEWFSEAFAAENREANVMALSTVSPDGKPSSRMVLLKEADEKGFRFFTNYQSRKGAEIAANHFVSLLFWWPVLERQVRIEGKVEKLTETASGGYFTQRPSDSQVSAIISPQSQVIPNRKYLEELVTAFRSTHPEPYSRPAYWGGFVVIPEKIEFWQGRPNRLHDRIIYTKTPGGWEIQRLAP